MQLTERQTYRFVIIFLCIMCCTLLGLLRYSKNESDKFLRAYIQKCQETRRLEHLQKVMKDRLIENDKANVLPTPNIVRHADSRTITVTVAHPTTH